MLLFTFPNPSLFILSTECPIICQIQGSNMTISTNKKVKAPALMKLLSNKERKKLHGRKQRMFEQAESNFRCSTQGRHNWEGHFWQTWKGVQEWVIWILCLEHVPWNVFQAEGRTARRPDVEAQRPVPGRAKRPVHAAKSRQGE